MFARFRVPQRELVDPNIAIGVVNGPGRRRRGFGVDGKSNAARPPEHDCRRFRDTRSSIGATATPLELIGQAHFSEAWLARALRRISFCVVNPTASS
jgi:hypothetical protein